MPNVKDLLSKIESGDISYEEKLAALSQVEASLQQMKAKKEERVKFNVQLIIDEIKKIKQDVQTQLDYARSIIPERGPKGDQGERGLDGAPGRDGIDGRNGRDGKDGKDGNDGISVTDAKIDFDGSLIITLSTGREINVGEVVSPDLAEKIKVTMSTNSSLTVSDEGSVLTSAVRKINFVGATVTASNAGDDVTVNVSAGTGSVTSVAMTTPTGLSVSGSPITTTGTLALSMTAGYSIPTTASQTNWDSAYSERRQWDGGSTNLVAATGRTSLGATTLGSNLFTITNPGAITFPRFNADNTVSSLDAATFRTAIGAGTGNGTVTSVGATSPVASSGGTTPTISLSSGYGDTQNPYASKTANFFLAAPNGSAGAPTFRAIVAADVPTLNQNTTGTASNVTGTVAIANGGTGQTTQQAALNALAGSTTSAQFLRGNGTNVLMSAIQASDVPTLNQNTTGTASNVTGVVAVANGGSGQTTAQSAMNTFAGAVTSGSYLRGNGTNVVMSTIQAADVPTLNQNTTGTASNVTGTVAIANGGTGQTTASAAFNALSPVTTTGDLIIGNGTNSATRLPIGANTYVLTSNGTTASWAAPSGGGSGTVTSVAATVPSFLSVSGSPITTSGTLAISLASTPSNGQLLIGNGTGFSYATLTAGSNITITNSAGGITIASTGGGGGGSTGPKAKLDTWMIGAM